MYNFNKINVQCTIYEYWSYKIAKYWIWKYAPTMEQNAKGRKRSELIKVNFRSSKVICKIRILHLLVNIAFKLEIQCSCKTIYKQYDLVTFITWKTWTTNVLFVFNDFFLFFNSCAKLLSREKSLFLKYSEVFKYPFSDCRTLTLLMILFTLLKVHCQVWGNFWQMKNLWKWWKMLFISP